MSPSKPFVHLHVHSQYSLLDGACRTADMVKRAKELGQSALAITDHGCLFGVIDFYNKARAENIKPIIGIEAYMAPGARTDRTSTGSKDGGYHLLLLAADRTGYANLLKLASIAYTEGFYYKPRIDKQTLSAHSAGLIATSACLGGEIPSALASDNRKRAREIAETYLQIFGPDRFFIELQKHIPEQDKVNPELIDLADRLGIAAVATNDVHFLLKDDHAPHDALCCISTGKLLTDQSRLKYPTQLYLKSADEMYAASDNPKWAAACENTARIADLCNLELDFKKSYTPVVKINHATTNRDPLTSRDFRGREGAVCSAPTSRDRQEAVCSAPTSRDRKGAVCSAPTSRDRKGAVCSAPTSRDRQEAVCSAPTSRDRQEAVCSAPTSRDRKGAVCSAPTSRDRQGAVCSAPTSRDRQEAVCSDPTSRDRQEAVCSDPTSRDRQEAVCSDPTSRDRQEAVCSAPTSRNRKGAVCQPQPHKNPFDENIGSTDWFKSICSQYQLQPFDQHTDQSTSPDQLKQQSDLALRELSHAGLTWRYGSAAVTDEHRNRLDRELKILADKNISAYFLIVWDFVNEAHRRGIPAMARGSGVGTMVGYCLGLSNACPVKYGLLFERFTDPDRSEYPDIDIDVCQEGRQEIIDYVRAKYGHVAQIITFGTLKARAALRDVGRVLNMPLPEVDKVCKLVGVALGTTIDKALEQEPDLRKLYNENPLHKQMIDTARRLEGLSRHAGVHAAGLVIATQPLDTIIPLYKPPGTEQIVTQWDGPTVEKVGLLKMDFLGLRTLTIIEKAKQLIRQTLSPQTIRQTVSQTASQSPANVQPQSEIKNQKSETSLQDSGLLTLDSGQLPDHRPLTTDHAPPSSDPLDLDRLDYTDQNVLDLFRRGETAGVFQFESGGMRNLLVAMKPDRLEDLIAANALFRPGPMDLIPDYCDRKHKRKPVPKTHPIVEQYTAETYGIMVYQEQVMQIVHGLGGIPLRAAYTLIKNISKKKQKDIDAVRPTFVQGAQQQGLSKQQADELFELILKFAGYGFNKSHSTGYAIIAYQTAYLKTYFPVHYMAAVLTYESVSTDKVVEYIDECKHALFPDGHRGIHVKPPDINLSEVGFTVVYDPDEPRDADHGHIRFGLSAVKGVGDKAIAAIIQARDKSAPFKSIYDFAERVPLTLVNRATIEALIKCGAFDSLHGLDKRAALIESVDGAVAAGQRAAAERDSGQLNFFGQPEDSTAQQSASTPAATIKLPTVDPWPHTEQLKHEKSVLGFFVSSHPMDQHHDTLDQFSSASCAGVANLPAGMEVVLGGMLTRVRPTLVKNGRSAGQKMAMLTLEDRTGPIETVVFSDAYALASPLLETDRIVFLTGKIDRSRERPSVIINRVVPIEQAARQLTQAVKITLKNPPSDNQADPNPTPEMVRLKELLRQAAAGAGLGNQPTAAVFFEIHQDQQIIELRVNALRVAVDPDLPTRVATVLRIPDCCKLLGPTKLTTAAGNTTASSFDSEPRYQSNFSRQPQPAEEELFETADQP